MDETEKKLRKIEIERDMMDMVEKIQKHERSATFLRDKVSQLEDDRNALMRTMPETEKNLVDMVIDFLNFA